MDLRRSYGLSSNLFVAPKTNSMSLVLGGLAEDTSRWTRVVSQRAAYVLWYHLTRHLFPEKAPRLMAAVQTMPSRTIELPTITHHLDITKLPNGMYEITGRIGEQGWTVRITTSEAQRLWDGLDVALYPKGWPGSAVASAED